MKRNLLAACLASAIILQFPVGEAIADPVSLEKQVNWDFYSAIEPHELGKIIASAKENNYIPIDFDCFHQDGVLQYSLVLRENTDNRDWKIRDRLNRPTFDIDSTIQRNLGYRMLDIDSYYSSISDQIYFCTIWMENVEAIDWEVAITLPAPALEAYSHVLKSSGYTTFDIDVVQVNNEARYTLLSTKPANSPVEQIIKFDLTRNQYQTNFQTHRDDGYWLVEYEKYLTDSGFRYAGIWEEKPDDFKYWTRTNRTRDTFRNYHRQYKDEGYRIVDYDRNGENHSGVWLENASRLKYEKKSDIDAAIDNFRTTNSDPGISVTVTEGGTYLYRRGFGDANEESGIKAHSKTVYNIASVSKAVAATLAVSLQSQGLIDLENDDTSEYLNNLPDHHDHTLEQLLAHTGCVGHYSNTVPEIRDLDLEDSHYSDAISAAPLFWDIPLVDNCTPDTNANYSTPAYTLLGAAMEEATEHDISTLLKQDLFEPIGMRDSRNKFVSTTPISDWDRATPYGNNGALSHEDTSWKVLGGGIESTSVDLVKLGNALLENDVVSAAERDDMWTRRSTRGTKIYGLGWRLFLEDGTDELVMVGHGGDQNGWGAYLAIYPNDQIVIAALTNFEVGSINLMDLANELKDIVIE